MRGYLLGVLFGAIMMLGVPAYAHPHAGLIMADEHTHSEIIPINDVMGLEKTTVEFNVPADNALPWGFVEGKIANHVDGYPVIIQMYSGMDGVHFAQVDVGEDDTYEYKFRVRNVSDGVTVAPFSGEYTAIVYKVVYLNPDFAAA